MSKVVVNTRKLLPWAFGAVVIIFVLGASLTSGRTPSLHLGKAGTHESAENGKLHNIQNATLGVGHFHVQTNPLRWQLTRQRIVVREDICYQPAVTQ